MAGVKDSPLEPKGYVQLTSAGVVLTPTVPAGSKYAMISVQTKGVRFRDDGTNPTGTTGVLIPVGIMYWYSGKVGALRFIEDGATSTAKVDILFYA